MSGGYLVARPATRDEARKEEPLVPATFWTASSCLARIAPDSWAIEWTGASQEQQRAEAARFGIPDDRVPALITWVTDHFDQDFGWPNVFLTLAAAREFSARFIPQDSDAAILGLALSPEDAEDFLRRRAPAEREGVRGVYQCLSRLQPPEPGGQPLGSEVLGAELDGAFHSYRCNKLEQDFAARLGARPNVHGLFEDHALARRCAQHASQAEVGAESVPWHAWYLTRYSRA